MLASLKTTLKELLAEAVIECYDLPPASPSVELEIPNSKEHGEFSCNIALQLTKTLHKSPMDIAAKICDTFRSSLQNSPIQKKVLKVETKKPGFINFFLSPEAFRDVLYQVFEEGEDYGRLNIGKRKKVQIEFVSANPTGPLSVAHARQAAVGDALANILNFVGFEAKKEYYVNDEGNQINILGKSIEFRAREILGEKVDFPEECYQGEYIKDMAKRFMEKESIKSSPDLDGMTEKLSQYGAEYLLGVIKKELEDFGVKFDIWTHQSDVATAKDIENLLKNLRKKKLAYEKDGALWFKSTDFEDDKDRVIRKSDGSFTYLTPDIVYHKNKFERGFEKIINIWGPDHHGYVPRIKAAVEALGHPREDIDVLIVQLATIYRNGQPLSMSTRKGQYISLREVIDEVGSDAARFFFLMRRCNAHLDFDLELAKKETPENPVYYIQYAHARIHSIFKKAKEAKIEPKHKDLSLLEEIEEIELMKKIGQFPDALVICHGQVDPYALLNYLQELAAAFHKFYDAHRVVDENHELSSQRLALIDAAKIVLANGLKLIGVSTPKKM